MLGNVDASRGGARRAAGLSVTALASGRGRGAIAGVGGVVGVIDYVLVVADGGKRIVLAGEDGLLHIQRLIEYGLLAKKRHPDILPDAYFTRIGLLQTRQNAEQGSFAGAIDAHQRYALTL